MKLSNKILLGLFAAIALNLLTGMVIMRSGLGPDGIGNGATYIEEEGANKKVRLTATDFSQLEIYDNYEVQLIQGEEEYVEIEAQKNIVDLFRVVKEEENVLTITAKAGYTIKPTSKVVLTIGFKDLNSIIASGGPKLFAQQPLNFDKLFLHLGGIGQLEAPIIANELDCKMNGATKAKLKGSIGQLNLTISGIGQFYGDSLTIRTAKASVNGAGFAQLNVEDYLNATTTRSGDVEYSGNPKVDQYTSGAGRIYKK
ncbi:MAG: head GIN domain-containing protein [Bacteroidota bacterium]